MLPLPAHSISAAGAPGASSNGATATLGNLATEPDRFDLGCAKNRQDEEGWRTIIQADQRERWLAGDRQPLEFYLERWPSLRERPDVLLALICNEYHLCEEVGIPASPKEFLLRFPEHAAALRCHFELQDVASDPSRTRHEPPHAPPGPANSPCQSATPGDSIPDPFPGEFRIQECVGRGSFGVVWLAQDLHLDRPVALKTLRLTGDPRSVALSLSNLQNEARILARLRHPNIVQVHAWRQAAGEHYLVLQYVSGGSLQQRLDREGPLPWADAARYIADAAEGLLEVHARGIVHRDIKPANLLWDQTQDEALLTDFGLSACRAADRGTIAGTPLFMAPEAFDGEVTARMDVYSLAASLFALVAGCEPFPTPPVSTLSQLQPLLLRQIAQGLPDPDPRCHGLPEMLEEAIRAGLTADPARRPNLRQFLALLRGTLNRVLADSLSPHPAHTRQGPVGLHLGVSRQVGTDTFVTLTASQPPPSAVQRDFKKVPRPPLQACLATGDRVRIEVAADRPGYVTVFNVGPTGNLNLLYPDNPGQVPALEANRPLHVLDVELAPPHGRERLLAVWTRQPVPLGLAELQSLAAAGELSLSQPYRATRDMLRVKDSVQRLNPEDWHAVVLEVQHGPAQVA